MRYTRRYFEEVQSMRQTRWVWYVLVPFLLVTLLPVIYLIYWQLILGERLGDTPMTDTELILFCSIMTTITVGTVWLFLSSKLEMYIDRDGIHYKFFPLSPHWKLIRKENITDVEICRKRNFLTMQTGYHKTPSLKTISMIVSGSLHIRLRLEDRWKMMIGTQNPEDFERAIRRLMTNDQNQ